MEQRQSFDDNDITQSDDDSVTVFQLEDRPVRGRVVRLGSAIDDILSAHRPPKSVSRLIGEAVLLAILIGDSLKFDGKLIIQASGPGAQGRQVEGTGAVAFVVAEYVPGKGVRAYAKYDEDRVATLEKVRGHTIGAEMLLGAGVFVMTIDPGEGMERYQGVTKLSGESLAQSAEHYFAQSEQVPTRVKLAVGEQMLDGGRSVWRAGGALIQQIAGDDTRGDTDGDFDHARALFETLGDDELVDPGITSGRLLYRLFHEDGVRLETQRAVASYCGCNAERLTELLSTFPSEDLEHMSRADGTISMTCEYCKREWVISAVEIDAAASAND